MNEQTLVTVVVPLVSALLGGVVVALTNSLLRKRLTDAEVGKIQAETAKIRAEAEHLQREQKTQQGYIGQLNFVVSHLLTRNEARFLRELMDGSNVAFKDEYREKDHLRRLRDLGFIDHKDKLQKIADLKAGDHLSDYLRATSAGRTYLQIVARTQEAA